MQYARFESNRIYRVGKLSVPYSGIMLIGGETTTFTPIHIVVSIGVSGAIKYGGTKPQGLIIKYDSESNIYVSGLAGKLFALRCFSIANDTLLALNEISSYPSGAVDVPSV